MVLASEPVGGRYRATCLVALILPYVPKSLQIDILILRLHLCTKFKSNRTIIHGDIAFQRFGGSRKCCHECSLCVYLVIDNFVYVLSDALFTYQIVKQLTMEILHLKDLGDTTSVVMNAVVLVLGDFNTNVPGEYLVYPPIKLYCNVLGIDNVMPL